MTPAGEGCRSVHLTLDDLKSKFKKHTVAAALQCTGNRRHELKEIKEVQVTSSCCHTCRLHTGACQGLPAHRCITQCTATLSLHLPRLTSAFGIIVSACRWCMLPAAAGLGLGCRCHWQRCLVWRAAVRCPEGEETYGEPLSRALD
jgi:Oxidoreductase molybdopterin binding domain